MKTDTTKITTNLFPENLHIRRTSQFLTKTLGQENFEEGTQFNLLLKECEVQNKISLAE